MSEGKKHDAGKMRHDLLPIMVLEGVAAVLTYGAKKYAPYDWMSVPDALARYRAAQERHFNQAVIYGETTDDESGLAHAWHYACNALFIAWLLVAKPELADEYARSQGVPR